MKAFENKEDLYQKAIRLERENLETLDVPVKMMKSRSYSAILRIPAIAAGIAAMLLIVIHLNTTNQNKKEMAVAQETIEKMDMNFGNSVSGFEEFGQTAKSMAESNSIIQRFNQKIVKYKKANS